MTDVMERLRTETSDLHHQAEGQEFQQRMLGGRLSRADYAEWLGQMYLIHRALEAPLRELRRTDDRFVAVTDEQYQEPYLLQDLETLEVDPVALTPLPATRRVVEKMARDAEEAPLRLLGYHYVLEGSNNGNRFLAKRLLPALGLEPGTADRYLDPYGAEQRILWQKFKTAMSGVEFSEAEADVLVAAAGDMFVAISELSRDLPTGPTA